MIEAETVIERRRLRRRLTLWRLLAVVLAVLFIALLATGNQRFAGSGSFLPHIARVSVSGIITDDQKMLELLDKVGKSSQVRAVILDINSPGGTTTGGEAMYDAIRRLAEKKPVVAVCGTLATSAAYIVALATDRIFVYGNTITGSVGVIFQWADVLGADAYPRRQGRGDQERTVEGGAESVRAGRREGARAWRGDGAGSQGVVRRSRRPNGAKSSLRQCLA